MFERANVARPSDFGPRYYRALWGDADFWSQWFACIHHNGRHHSAWLRYTEKKKKKEIREVSRSGAQKRKARDWMLEEKERFGGVIASKVFQTRPRTLHVLVRRDDPPTHSCWRSVVDDNGNPIFRNNICLEDRRLTSCDADVYTRVYSCDARACARSTKYSIPAVTSLILSAHPFRDVLRRPNWEE